MKKLLIIFLLFPVLCFGQKYQIKQTLSGNSVLFSRGATALDAQGYYNVRTYGAKGDSTTLDQTACQAAIDAAYAAGGGTVYFPKGVYRINTLSGYSNVNLLGDGAKLVGTASITTGHYILELHGSSGTNTDLTSNGMVSDDHIHVTSSASWSAGDYILILDNIYAYSTLGRNQELNRVLSVSSGLINLKRGLISSYITGQSAKAYVLHPIHDVIVEGLTFENLTGAYGGGVEIDLGFNIRIINCNAQNAYNQSFQAVRSTEVSFINCIAKDGQNLSGFNGYGFVFGESSHHCIMTGCYTERVRESACTTASKFIRVENNIFKDSYDSGFNTHGSSNKFIDIINNTAIGGGTGFYASGDNASDRDINIIGNRVVNTLGHGITVFGTADSLLYRIVVKNNTISNFGLTTAGNDFGILARYINDSDVSGNTVNGLYGAGTDYGIYADHCINTSISKNIVKNIVDGYGIAYATCTNVTISDNRLNSIQSNNLYGSGTNSGIIITGNYTDDATNAFDNYNSEYIKDNYFAGALREYYQFYITATNNGTGTGILTANQRYIVVESDNANYIVCLPAASSTTRGYIIKGNVAANGFELRVAASQAGTVYINGVTTNVEAAIPANSSFEIICVDATHWVLKAWTALGTEITAIVPDAI